MALCEKTKIRPPSKVTMKIQWIPYTYADHETGAHAGDKKHKHHKCAALAIPETVWSRTQTTTCLLERVWLSHAFLGTGAPPE